MDEHTTQILEDDGVTVLRVAVPTAGGGECYFEAGFMKAAARRRRIPTDTDRPLGRPLVEARAQGHEGGRSLIVHRPDLGTVRVNLDREAAADLARQLAPAKRRSR